MLRRLRFEPVAVGIFAEALVAFLLAIGAIDEGVGAGLSGLVAAGLVLVRQVVTPVVKVAKLLERPTDAVNRMLVKVKA